MRGRFNFELLSSYPHLSPRESEIWNRFIQKYPTYCERVDYDIAVGNVPIMEEELEEEWEHNARYLGSYKIDAVGYDKGKHFIFEIRHRAGPSALGNLMTYMFLYQERVGEGVDAEPVLVTDLERPDIRRLCAEHDIDYIVV